VKLAAGRRAAEIPRCHSRSILNLILFEHAEISVPLARSDRRAIHLLEVLRRIKGASFDAGIINGPRGKGVLTDITEVSLSLSFSWDAEPTLSDPLTLVIGMPRPQTARTILREVAALGVSAVHFVSTQKGDANYAQSTLWSGGEWRRHLVSGAEQAFCTRLPEVTFNRSMIDTISALQTSGTSRIALDNYESPVPLTCLDFSEPAVTLAIGPERGWSNAERESLRQNGFALAHLGSRVLRTETACIAAIVLVKAKMGWL
jgi:RsmE family RNA methyltransferase